MAIQYIIITYQCLYFLVCYITFSICKEATVGVLCIVFIKYLSTGCTFIKTTNCLNDL